MRSLVFVWPYALLFWAVIIWAFVPEFRILRAAREQPSGQDAHSKRLIESGQGISWIAALAIAAALPSSALPNPGLLFWTGLAATVAGSLLRRHCRLMLGQSFTGTVIVKPDQAVIERGAYRYVRHPSYTAGALLFLGIGIALANWLSLAVLLISTVVVYAYRVRVEESALVTVIGEPYRVYMARTKRFVPYLF